MLRMKLAKLVACAALLLAGAAPRASAGVSGRNAEQWSLYGYQFALRAYIDSVIANAPNANALNAQQLAHIGYLYAHYGNTISRIYFFDAAVYNYNAYTTGIDAFSQTLDVYAYYGYFYSYWGFWYSYYAAY